MRRPVRPMLVSIGVFVAAAVVLGITVWPQAVGAERLTLFAYSTALRGALLVALGLAAIVLGVTALLSRRGRRVLVPIAAAFALAALVNGAVIAERGFTTPISLSEDEVEVRVLSWNTEHAAPGGAAIAELIIEVDADIVVLPETDEAAVVEIAAALETTGMQSAHDTIDHDDFPGSTPTSILFIGEVASQGYEHDIAQGSTPGQPSGVWRPADDVSPVVSAVHTVPPMPWATPLWSAGLDWVAARCAEPRAIIAGDLNATVDHLSGLGPCRDAAVDQNAAAIGTWPTNVPRELGAPIDHILVGTAWQVVSYEVLEAESAPGSDHRPIVAQLRTAEGAP